MRARMPPAPARRSAQRPEPAKPNGPAQGEEEEEEEEEDDDGLSDAWGLEDEVESGSGLAELNSEQTDSEAWGEYDSEEEEALRCDDAAFTAGIEPRAMHCALLEHDARLLAPLPVMHAGVAARTHHHQTADAVAFVPGGGGGGGGAEGAEEVVVSCGARLMLWQLGASPQGVGCS
jgi:hypothetical protein